MRLAAHAAAAVSEDLLVICALLMFEEPEERYLARVRAAACLPACAVRRAANLKHAACRWSRPCASTCSWTACPAA